MIIRVSILSCTAKNRQSAAAVQFFNIKLKGRATKLTSKVRVKNRQCLSNVQTDHKELNLI